VPRESDLRLGFSPPLQNPRMPDQPATPRSELDDKRCRGGSHVFVFQQVDQLAQPAIVAAVGYRFDKRRLQPSAQTAAGLARADSIRTEHPFPANRANAARDGAGFGKTRPAKPAGGKS
jgi:hypothetical protein